MLEEIKNAIIEKVGLKNEKDSPQILSDFSFKTDKRNQLLAFFKPEVFLGKVAEQTAKIIDFAFKKLEENEVTIEGVALYPGQAIGKYSIMDRHYGVINTLSKNASKILTKDERDLIFKSLDIKNQNTKILGGHEAFEISGMGKTYEFDNYWLSTPSTKIRGGFYVKTMKVADEEVVVVNGFHPHQLAHYTEPGHYLAVMLVASNTPWDKLRREMLGETFPEKALPSSIRGHIYSHASDFGFEKVGIENNIMHLSAGPTEAAFEIDNFFKEPFGIDFIEKEAKLAEKLLMEGIKPEKIRELLNNKALHAELEHKDTDEAIEIIKRKINQ